jgi:hypothetical protein
MKIRQLVLFLTGCLIFIFLSSGANLPEKNLVDDRCDVLAQTLAVNEIGAFAVGVNPSFIRFQIHAVTQFRFAVDDSVTVWRVAKNIQFRFVGAFRRLFELLFAIGQTQHLGIEIEVFILNDFQFEIIDHKFKYPCQVL